MFVNDRHITYSSPPHKRKLARVIAVVSAVVLVLIFVSVASDYRKRKAAGYDPLPASSLVLPSAPLMMLGIGLWIGWGHTRIDLRRGVAERRPLGVPWLAKIVRLRDAERLYVGYFRAPTMVATPGAGVIYTGKLKGRAFWFVRLEGDRAQLMLIAQRGYDEALAFAGEIGERVDLPVEIAEPPEE